MLDAGFGNKKFRIHQRRYLGSKSRLLHYIDEVLHQEAVKFNSIFDIFGGTGIVAAHYFKKSDIIVNDILESNYLAYLSFFGQEEIKEKYLIHKLCFYNDLNIEKFEDNYFSKNFANTYCQAPLFVDTESR